MGFAGSHEIPESLHCAGSPWLTDLASLLEPLGPPGKDGVKQIGLEAIGGMSIMERNFELTHFSDEKIEDAFARIRAEFESRSHAHGQYQLRRTPEP